MTFPKPYDPLESMAGMIVHYGLPPSDESPRVPWGGMSVCGSCGRSLNLAGVCPVCNTVPLTFTPVIDPPPPYASDPETAAIDALGKLNPEQASRVIAWACSRFGVPGPIRLQLQAEKDAAARGRLDEIDAEFKAVLQRQVDKASKKKGKRK